MVRIAVTSEQAAALASAASVEFCGPDGQVVVRNLGAPSPEQIPNGVLREVAERYSQWQSGETRMRSFGEVMETLGEAADESRAGA